MTASVSNLANIVPEPFEGRTGGSIEPLAIRPDLLAGLGSFGGRK
jgi:hypothetical protein